MTDDNPKMIALHGRNINLYIEPGPALGPVLEVTVDNIAEAKLRLVNNGRENIKDEPDFPAMLREGSVWLNLQLDHVKSVSTVSLLFDKGLR